MQPHQQRVIDEKNDLDEKISKLEAFFSTHIFNELDQEDASLLQLQSIQMQGYSRILKARIDRF